MTDGVEVGDWVHFRRTAIQREVGKIEQISDHVIYGPDGEVCIHSLAGPRYHLPREDVIEVLAEDELVECIEMVSGGYVYPYGPDSDDDDDDQGGNAANVGVMGP